MLVGILHQSKSKYGYLDLERWTYSRSVVPNVSGSTPLLAVRNSRGAVKQKCAIEGR